MFPVSVRFYLARNCNANVYSGKLGFQVYGTGTCWAGTFNPRKLF